jgi:hypothetical protein
MKVPKLLLYAIFISFILASLTRWFPPAGVSKSSATNLLTNVPKKEQLLEFVKVLDSNNPNKIKYLLDRLGAKDIDMVSNSIEGGVLVNAWGLVNDGDVSRIALELNIRYIQGASIQREAKALFVFRYKDSEWQIEWFSPGAVLLPKPNT